MIFKNYLEKVLGSKVKIKIIRTLFRFPEKRFTARELANFIGASHTPVLKSLPDLEGMNLISVEKHGNSKLIKLNKKSYICDSIKGAISNETSAKERLIFKIKKIIPSADMIVLFGSIQKEKESMKSDIDLLVVSESKKKIYDTIIGKQKSIIDEFGNNISAIVLTKKELIKKKNKPFAKDLLKNYRLIHGEDLIKKYWK